MENKKRKYEFGTIVRWIGSIILCIAAIFIIILKNEDWKCIDWITFVSGILAVEGLVLAWTELKANSEVIADVKKQVIARQIMEEKGYLASELTMILDFASNQNYDKAHITFVFIRQRLRNVLPQDKIPEMENLEKKLLKNRNAMQGVSPQTQTFICNALRSIRTSVENLQGD